MDERPSPSPSAVQFNAPREGESPLGISQTPPRLSIHDESPEDMNRRSRRASNPSTKSSPERGNGRHITMNSPSPNRLRPRLPDRQSRQEQSARSISEALRVARRREEQETLLEDDEQADDDGCYPPRKNSVPWQPNPHAKLPVYTTIHRIRRLVIASIGKYTLKETPLVERGGLLTLC